MKSPLFLRFAGLGDALFVNTIAFHYARQNSCSVYVASNYPELFKNTPNVIHLPTKSQRIAHQIGKLMKRSGMIDSMIYMGYQVDGPGALMQPMDDHILSVLADKVGLTSAPTRPVLFLSPSELQSAALPQNGKPWIAMHSTGVTEMTENKNWFPERFDEVARQLRHKYRVVQLGRPSDPSIESDLDLRGIINPRQASATIASCSALICQVGFLMHAAAAVGTPATVIYGGFEAPEESGYECNINLFTKLPCAPCWLRTKCPYDKKCMNAISAQDVLNALDKLLTKEFVQS
jgi:hypothetical protein